MPALTRRREKDRHQESWRIYFGDVQVGWIGERAGVPKGVDQWGWSCAASMIFDVAAGMEVAQGCPSW